MTSPQALLRGRPRARTWRPCTRMCASTHTRTHMHTCACPGSRPRTSWPQPLATGRPMSHSRHSLPPPRTCVSPSAGSLGRPLGTCRLLGRIGRSMLRLLSRPHSRETSNAGEQRTWKALRGRGGATGDWETSGSSSAREGERGCAASSWLAEPLLCAPAPQGRWAASKGLLRTACSLGKGGGSGVAALGAEAHCKTRQGGTAQPGVPHICAPGLCTGGWSHPCPWRCTHMCMPAHSCVLA